ncbi:hypothetical protein FUA48_16180 [Flavobacterium alkalisoli]|uniref:Uncharacterized protein n=1 Tax=Flavobacterium alkalisoli TaxID=2602769 RepID=A0A5B9FZ33_9FLAO|nr:hypothetical protein [Flavobacterium alkalisoli]QEE51058.1 hypothetical protein FUA48_16180 [Flavobacterium alkalisoli]
MSTLKTYTITGTSFEGSLVFKYDLNGSLQSYELDGELNDVQKKWLYNGRFPFNEVGIRTFMSINNFTVHGGELDLSFDHFWDAYAFKVGKKPMAANIWKRMSKADKIAALTGIKPYDAHLRRHLQREKANPTTYLNQRYWENEWNKY